jgi:hypothetical protein
MAEHNSTHRVQRPSLGVRLFPIVFFISYLTFTVLLFAFGPWRYPMAKTGKLYLFLAFAHLALFLGYLSAIFRAPAVSRFRLNYGALVIISSVVALLFFFPTSAARTGHAIPQIVEGLNDPGVAYAASLRLREAETGFVEYLRILLGPVLALSFPLTWFAFRQLTPLQRMLGISAMLSTVVLFIAMGTNKAIADTVLLIPWMVWAGHLASVSRLTRKFGLSIAAIALLGFTGFLLFFAKTTAGRAGSIAVAGILPTTGAYVDADNKLTRNLPDSAAIGVYGLTHYLSSGYYALYLSLKAPFVPCYGVGNSIFLYRQAARVSGDKSILRKPYPVRIEQYGWDAYGLWSSIYPWLASDVSFPGVILLVFLIGRLFAMSWLDTIGGANPLAAVVFAHFIIMLFYFPANNQLMQSGQDFTAFWVILVIWLFLRSPRSVPGPSPEPSALHAA